MVEYEISMVLQTVCKVYSVHTADQWKNFENRSITGENIDKSKVPHFLAHPVHLQAQLQLQLQLQLLRQKDWTKDSMWIIKDKLFVARINSQQT